MEADVRKFLFVINRAAGRRSIDWRSVILEHFKNVSAEIDIYYLPENFTPSGIRSVIDIYGPDHVIAVGGDGTANLLAGCIMNTKMSLGIVPAGSANGMAKELGIGNDIATALDIIARGFRKKISLVQVNDRISLHLADLGLNAHMLREFERMGTRGLIGYLWATLKVLSRKKLLHFEITHDNKKTTVDAVLIIIANATSYGTGVVVNPVGRLDDDVFEVIAIKELTLGHLLKSSLHTSRLDVSKAEIFRASRMRLHCSEPAPFQVDGEYLDKVQDVVATLLPASLEVIVKE